MKTKILGLGSLILVLAAQKANAQSAGFVLDTHVAVVSMWSHPFNSTYYLSFTNADGGPVAIKQFTGCDPYLIHAEAERKNHCNTNIGVHIYTYARWWGTPGAYGSWLDLYAPIACNMDNDSYEDKCAKAATTTTTAAATTNTTTNTTTSTASSGSASSTSTASSSSTSNTSNVTKVVVTRTKKKTKVKLK